MKPVVRTIINDQHWHTMRSKVVTSTDVSALFGLSPYCTAFELWHRKKSGVNPDFISSERVRWGNILQDSIAKGFCEERKLWGARFDKFAEITELGAGSSFDWVVGAEAEKPTAILEIKNVDSLVFKNDWVENEDGTFEAPAHIEIQVQHQLLVSGMKMAYIAALVGGNRLIIIERERNAVVIDSIIERVKEFWASIKAGQEPEPTFPQDAEFIGKLYGHAEPGKVIDVGNDVATMVGVYKKLGDEIKGLEADRDALKAQILIAIGDAEKAIGDGFSISAGLVGPATISYERKPYRCFKVYFKKSKGE